ncbi:MAG: M36 family metallopeptidase, partial [Thermoanaerobaculia bacterium]
MKYSEKTTLVLLIGVLAFVWAFPLGAGPNGRPVESLTSVPSTAPPLEIALSYIRQIPEKGALTDDDVADLVVKSRYVSSHNQTTHVYLRQRFHGLEVIGSDTNINIAADGRVINIGDRLVPDLKSALDTRAPVLSAAAAVRAAAGHLGLEVRGLLMPLKTLGGAARETRFSGAGLSLEEIPVKLVYYAGGDGRVRLAWDMVIRTVDQKHWWNLWVAAGDGEVLAKADWIAHDTYEVFALPLESPSDGSRTVEANVADPVASPFGWHDADGSPGAEFTDTRGNNVFAQEDTDADNAGGFRPDGGAGLDFQFPLDLTQDPSSYQPAAITNLFYWNNVLHDVLYRYGFDEASGNFQLNNYGNFVPGSGDPVQADAQDGSGTNNANFGTPPDGFAPRMQMFVWLPPGANEVEIDAPSSAEGTFTASGAGFGPALDAAGVSGSIELGADNTAPVNDACEPLIGFTAGNIALVDRGVCAFVTKVRNAQNVGATAVIVTNDRPGDPITMGDDGTGGDIVIGSVMVSDVDGATIKAGLPATGTVRGDPNPPPNRDSDFDNGVIAHEYGHGVSNRLTGGRGNVNCLFGNQSGGMGEGWSDFWALTFTAKQRDKATDPRGVGTYVLFEPPDGGGIRQFPYTTDLSVNPHTFSDIASVSVPHGVGSVWNAALWEVYWNLVGTYGFDPDLYGGTGGNNLAIQLVIDGMKLQPCKPTFVDARDAILLADQDNNGGVNECDLW